MKEIDLSKILKLLLKHIVPIIVSGVVCAIAVFGYYSFFVSPVYKTVTTILVNNGGLAQVGPSGDSVSTGDISASLQLVTTCVDILESDNIYKELSKALDNKYTYQELMPHFTAVPRSENSLLIDISTIGGDPKEIKDVANTFLEIAPTFISNNILNVDVKILATADTASKIMPSAATSALVALFAGAGVCALVYIVIYMSKNTIDGERDFKANYDIPLLGTVPLFETKQSGGKRREKSK